MNSSENRSLLEIRGQAPYKYNSSKGRWLSRDPIQEAGGFNLTSFIANMVPNNTDLLGQKLYFKNPFPISHHASVERNWAKASGVAFRWAIKLDRYAHKLNASPTPHPRCSLPESDMIAFGRNLEGVGWFSTFVANMLELLFSAFGSSFVFLYIFG